MDTNKPTCKTCCYFNKEKTYTIGDTTSTYGVCENVDNCFDTMIVDSRPACLNYKPVNQENDMEILKTIISMLDRY